MKKYIFAILLFFGLTALIFIPAIIFAASALPESDHTASEVKEGKEVLEKLRANEVKCGDLNNGNFEALGEYFMEQMFGVDDHLSMNNMMTQMHGKEGEEQIHLVMGKRLSGCDKNAVFDSNFSMMNMISNFGNQNGESSANSAGKSLFSRLNYNMPMMQGFQNNMMTWGGVGLTFGIIGLILMVLWWLFVIAAIVFLVKWIARQFKNGDSTQKSVLDILKERYARGEIDKNEFEEKKKDLL